MLAEIYYSQGYYRKAYNTYKNLIVLEKNNLSDYHLNAMNRITELFEESNDYNSKDDKATYEFIKLSPRILEYVLNEKNSKIDYWIDMVKTMYQGNKLAQNDKELIKKLEILEIKNNIKILKFEDARKQLEQIKETIPLNQVLSKFHLGSINVYLKNTDKAVENYENAQKLIKDNKLAKMRDLSVNIHFLLTHYYLLLGNRKKAIDSLKEVQNLEPSTDESEYTESFMKFLLSQKE
jgi:tetratricopeptide (TPR) repeat protein